MQQGTVRRSVRRRDGGTGLRLRAAIDGRSTRTLQHPESRNNGNRLRGVRSDHRRAVRRRRGRRHLGRRRGPDRQTVPDHPKRKGQRRHLRVPGHRDVSEMRERAVRPLRPPVPAPVHQLHGLRTAADHPRLHALRPGADLHGGVPDVPGLRGGVHEPEDPALPRPARLLQRLRPGAVPRVRPGRRDAPPQRRAVQNEARHPGRRHRRHQRHRRVPPLLRRHERSGRRPAAGTQGPAVQTLRGHVERHRRREAGMRRPRRSGGTPDRAAETDPALREEHGRRHEAVSVHRPRQPERGRHAALQPGAVSAVPPPGRPG